MHEIDFAYADFFLKIKLYAFTTFYKKKQKTKKKPQVDSVLWRTPPTSYIVRNLLDIFFKKTGKFLRKSRVLRLNIASKNTHKNQSYAWTKKILSKLERNIDLNYDNWSLIFLNFIICKKTFEAILKANSLIVFIN